MNCNAANYNVQQAAGGKISADAFNASDKFSEFYCENRAGVELTLAFSFS